MRLTLHTDYALRVLTYLALRPGRPVTVSDVAAAYGISRHHLLKVARTLRTLGVVGTTRGRSGGIRLAQSPERIGIGRIVRATEADFALVGCQEPRCDGCPIAPSCRLGDAFGAALAAFLAVLDRYTLADMLRNRAALRSLLGMAGHAA